MLAVSEMYIEYVHVNAKVVWVCVMKRQRGHFVLCGKRNPES